MSTYHSIVIMILSLIPVVSICRSIHRPRDPLMPSITTRWVDTKKSYTLESYYLEEYPIFLVYNKEYFEKYMLPSDLILHRHSLDKQTLGIDLKADIDGVIKEIKTGKRIFKNFRLLQNKDFNHRRSWGLIVLKSKKYPFVVKLFMETPQSFISPYHKGFEPMCCFFMGGGINRHLTGFTRIPNLELAKQRLHQFPRWAQLIDTPRKWFYIPTGSKLIEVQGKNIGGEGRKLVTHIPGTYCIVADAITPVRELSIFNPTDREIALGFCNDMRMLVDPHISNFMVEEGTNKLVLVDTEHFPTLVGLRTECKFNSYASWYTRLAGKCFSDTMLRTKRERRAIQYRRSELALTY